MGEWMIYGANGYTGRLVLAEAVRRGLHPILAGRNAKAVAELAQQYGLAARSFCLSDPATAASALSGIPLVLHCAGPFSETCEPMLEACLASGAHYLDITGEIDVFRYCHAQHERARERGIVVLPGSGFDVVPTDCLAAMLAKELPDSRALTLCFEAGGGPSPGTAKTSVEGLSRGGRIRRDGQLVDVPLAYKEREFLREGEVRSAVTIPWGDVYTAYVSTGIPNVEVYMVVPAKTIARLRTLRRFAGLLAWKPVQAFMKSRVGKQVHGPSERKRSETFAHIWGEVVHPSGKSQMLQLRTPNGYDLTVSAALGIAQHVLAAAPAGGYYTPSQLMGAEYVLGLPGVKLLRR
jgi:short subunit dehydrogenase-like uncharacterized protein